MINFSMKKVIGNLRLKRRVFTSEADLQLALAHEIEETYPKNAKVRMEYSPNVVPRKHIDILVIWSSIGKETKWIPIELKYKTKAFAYTDEDGCFYDLRNHSAHDCGCYDYIKDISRIESLKREYNTNFGTGFAVFLTNDNLYWINSNRRANYDNFRIFNDRIIDNETLVWRSINNVSDERNAPIHLEGRYQFNWTDYSVLGDESFKILISEI